MAENKKKSGFSLRRLIYNDKYLIIVSLVLAIIIWIGTSLNTGVSESKTIKLNTPIAISDEVSDQLGIQYYSLQDNIELSVTITGPKYVIGQVTQNDLAVAFDTSSVSRTGEHTIPIMVSNASRRLDFEISGTYPSSVQCYFDVNATKIFNVTADYDDRNVADGYIFGTPVLSDEKIVVSGPKTHIDKIEAAKVNIDFDGKSDLKDMYKANCGIDLIGDDIERSYISITTANDDRTPLDQISVTVPVLKKTSLPINVDLVDKPTDFNDYAIHIRYSVDEVEAGVLESADISTATIGSVKFSDLNVGTQTFEFDVTKLNGITILDDTKTITATITIGSAYTQKSIAVDKNSIVIDGVPNGYSAKIKSIDANNIKVIAPSNTSIKNDDITLKCDISKHNDNGVYPIEVKVNSRSSWVYGTYSANIELIKQK